MHRSNGAPEGGRDDYINTRNHRSACGAGAAVRGDRSRREAPGTTINVPQAEQPEPGRRRWAVLAVVSAAQFLIVLDLWVINIALPALQHDFAPATLPDVSWILDAYAIVLATLLLPAGRAADSIGRRECFLAGLVVFGIASLGCALAPGSPRRARSRARTAACGPARNRPPASRQARPAAAGRAAGRPASWSPPGPVPARSRRAPGSSRCPAGPAWTRTGTRMPAGTAASASRAPSPARTGTPPGPSSAARRPSASPGRRRPHAGARYASAHGHRNRAAHRPGCPASPTATPPRRRGRRPRRQGRTRATAAWTAAPPRPSRCPGPGTSGQTPHQPGRA